MPDGVLDSHRRAVAVDGNREVLVVAHATSPHEPSACQLAIDVFALATYRAGSAGFPRTDGTFRIQSEVTRSAVGDNR
jgi:hypothetical protein